ncbi:MAG: purine nucleoside permease, partial [Verrucomicrobiota bacterium]
GPDSPPAQAPSVTVGGNMASARYFHGELATQWAQRWMQHWSGGKSIFTSCGMEDTGSLHAIAHLEKLGLAQMSRVLILRTISNFTLPPPGECPTEHFHDKNAFPAFDLALENGYRVATAVIDHLLAEET